MLMALKLFCEYFSFYSNYCACLSESPNVIDVHPHGASFAIPAEFIPQKMGLCEGWEKRSEVDTDVLTWPRASVWLLLLLLGCTVGCHLRRKQHGGGEGNAEKAKGSRDRDKEKEEGGRKRRRRRGEHCITIFGMMKRKEIKKNKKEKTAFPNP